MQFVDESKILVESGNGGTGCVSFRREKFISHGGPNGGDGGRGGDIIFECVINNNTLVDYRFQQHFRAESGEAGRGNNRHGKNGETIILKVPVGTQVFDESGEVLLADLTVPGQRALIAKGGDGGFGNAHFKSSTNQAPRKFIPGFPGQKFYVWLKLKLISDAGLVGLPNAGKSSFLAATTRAKPKIADYPFTTLKPQLGVVYSDGNEFVIADIPGLIKDASIGRGLGDKFLKHIERCGVILHLIDISAENIVENYLTIRHELENYSEKLQDKFEVIALNKADLLDAQETKKKVQQLKKVVGKNTKIFTMSNATRKGVPEVLRELYRNILLHREQQQQITDINNDE